MVHNMTLDEGCGCNDCEDERKRLGLKSVYDKFVKEKNKK